MSSMRISGVISWYALVFLFLRGSINHVFVLNHGNFQDLIFRIMSISVSSFVGCHCHDVLCHQGLHLFSIIIIYFFSWICSVCINLAFCVAFKTLTGLTFLGALMNLISYLLPLIGSLGLISLTLLYCYDICRGLGSKVGPCHGNEEDPHIYMHFNVWTFSSICFLTLFSVPFLQLLSITFWCFIISLICFWVCLFFDVMPFLLRTALELDITSSCCWPVFKVLQWSYSWRCTRHISNWRYTMVSGRSFCFAIFMNSLILSHLLLCLFSGTHPFTVYVYHSSAVWGILELYRIFICVCVCVYI